LFVFLTPVVEDYGHSHPKSETSDSWLLFEYVMNMNTRLFYLQFYKCAFTNHAFINVVHHLDNIGTRH
jgi:hypothetical protein